MIMRICLNIDRNPSCRFCRRGISILHTLPDQLWYLVKLIDCLKITTYRDIKLTT